MTKTPYNIALVKKQKPFFKRNYQGKYHGDKNIKKKKKLDNISLSKQL